MGILPWPKDIQIGIQVETEWVRWLSGLAAEPEDPSSSLEPKSRRESPPINCPLTSTHMPWHTDAHRHMQINVKKKNPEIENIKDT